MSNPGVQTYETHVQRVPTAYSIAFLLILVSLLWNIYALATGFSMDRLMMLLVTMALAVATSYARTFALRVQDRVIRLETRLRLAQLLPADLQPRIGELTLGQLVALRFASDAELPELARRVLTDRITDRKTIKKMIKTWEGDWMRV